MYRLEPSAKPRTLGEALPQATDVRLLRVATNVEASDLVSAFEPWQLSGDIGQTVSHMVYKIVDSRQTPIAGSIQPIV